MGIVIDYYTIREKVAQIRHRKAVKELERQKRLWKEEREMLERGETHWDQFFGIRVNKSWKPPPPPPKKQLPIGKAAITDISSRNIERRLINVKLRFSREYKDNDVISGIPFLSFRLTGKERYRSIQTFKWRNLIEWQRWKYDDVLPDQTPTPPLEPLTDEWLADPLELIFQVDKEECARRQALFDNDFKNMKHGKEIQERLKREREASKAWWKERNQKEEIKLEKEYQEYLRDKKTKKQ